MRRSRALLSFRRSSIKRSRDQRVIHGAVDDFHSFLASLLSFKASL